jgi:hypothetical protein
MLLLVTACHRRPTGAIKRCRDSAGGRNSLIPKELGALADVRSLVARGEYSMFFERCIVSSGGVSVLFLYHNIYIIIYI